MSERGLLFRNQYPNISEQWINRLGFDAKKVNDTFEMLNNNVDFNRVQQTLENIFFGVEENYQLPRKNLFQKVLSVFSNNKESNIEEKDYFMNEKTLAELFGQRGKTFSKKGLDVLVEKFTNESEKVGYKLKVESEFSKEFYSHPHFYLYMTTPLNPLANMPRAKGDENKTRLPRAYQIFGEVNTFYWGCSGWEGVDKKVKKKAWNRRGTIADVFGEMKWNDFKRYTSLALIKGLHQDLDLAKSLSLKGIGVNVSSYIIWEEHPQFRETLRKIVESKNKF